MQFLIEPSLRKSGSSADKDSLHVKFADEAICIGDPDSRESY